MSVFRFCASLLAASLVLSSTTFAATQSTAKRNSVAAVDKHAASLIRLSDQVWAFAETALLEHRSAKLLADFAEGQGFKVERGISNMPTAFVASYGTGRPIVAIMGEYYALPGVSQKATPEQDRTSTRLNSSHS